MSKPRRLSAEEIAAMRAEIANDLADWPEEELEGEPFYDPVDAEVRQAVRDFFEEADWLGGEP